ncbi:cytochrome P450, partial [Catenaria anguillulae PL171]
MEECLDELYGVLDKATVKGNVVDFQELSVALTLNVIGRTALDTEFDALNNTHSPLHSAYNHLLESFSISAFNVLQGFLPFLRYMPIKRNRDIAQARDVTRDQVTRIIQRIKTDGAQAASTSVPSLMRVLLENQKRQVVGEDGTDGKLTQDEIRDEALTFLVAGHETTSNALSMTLYFLAAYPDTQSALYSALVDMPDHASLDDLLKLEALHQVVNEGLRVHSPVFATNRIALADQHVPLSDGRTLFMPKGTMLVVPIQAMHYDPELFPNPHVFQPDRWKSLRLAGHDDADLTSPTTGSGSGVRRDVHPMQFLPFLAGSRACIGRNFALMELKLFLAGIVKRYRVRLPDEEHARVAGKGERPKVHYSITARPEVVRLVF